MLANKSFWRTPPRLFEFVRYCTVKTTIESKCWNCNRQLVLPADTATFTCPCDQKVLLPPATTNYFAIMNCRQSYEVDVKSLRRRYHFLQVLLHPDKYSLKAEEEQKLAVDHSSLVNKAYNTLINPYQRGLYLLQLNGLSIDEKDNMSSDVEFLEGMMATNEEIHSNPSQERLQELNCGNEAKLSHLVSLIAKHFSDGDAQAAKDGLIRLKYYVNLKQELYNKLSIL